MTVQIAPSILSADFARLGDAVTQAEDGGADLIHVDVMDGRFVPNITIGVPVVAALNRVARVPLDVHLMIEDPGRYVEAFVTAGAATLTVHVEVLPHLHRTLSAIRELGARAGVALNPSTPVETIADVIDLVDHVLIMSVNPGFGGQTFIPRSLDRVARMRDLLTVNGSDASIGVDGGVDVHNAGRLVRAGATVLVAGSAIYGSADVAGAIQALRRAAAEA
ncbi:MAG: ribulose-phosphate 3-epimerase [Acidobacteria bacterium]|nr:ribulose-phosphate 3-epimerase [Acidobacteriota bacterium]